VRRTAIALGAVAMGCTTLESYVPPADGPRAEVRFLAATLGGVADVVAASEAGCTGAGRLIARLHERQPPDLRPVYLADGALAGVPSVGASVPAARPIDVVIQAQGLLDGWYEYACARAVSFTPADGERYDVVYINTDPYRCSIDVWRVGGEGRRTRVEEASSAACPIRAYRAERPI
jgi:hypothetical protein